MCHLKSYFIELINHKVYGLYFVIMLMLWSCGTTNNSIVSEEQMNQLESMVNEKRFKIESDVAYPRNTYALTQASNAGLLGQGNTANRVSLIGNPNVLEVSGDSISSQLPYFGERQAGYSYPGRRSGIQLEGLMDDYSAEWDDKKRRYEIRFTAKDENESYDVFILLYPNKVSNMVLTGARSFSIEYRGRVSAIE